MDDSPRARRLLKLVLVVSIVGYATGRSYEAVLFLSDQMQPASEACTALWCAVALDFHLWAGYLCAPLAVAALVLLARSTRLSSIVGGAFLVVMFASDTANRRSVGRRWRESRAVPMRDKLLGGFGVRLQ